VLISPAVIFVTVLVAGPLALAIWLSFTNATTGLHGKWVGLDNFRHEWSNPAFQHAVWHTFLFTVISQAIVLVGAGLIAHAMLRNFKGKWVLRFLILLPWAAPIALSLMAWKWIFDPAYSILTWTLQHLHLVSQVSPPVWLGQSTYATAAVIVVQAWRILPFAVVIFIAGLASIPKEVDDAAAIDGATGFRKFWSVTLPLQLPIATVALLFGIVFTATDMAVVYILTQGGPPPSFSTEQVTTWSYKTAIESGSLGPGASISLALLPVLAVVSVRDAALRPPGGGHVKEKGLSYLIVGPFAIVLAFPFYVMVITAFKDQDGVLQPGDQPVLVRQEQPDVRERVVPLPSHAVSDVAEEHLHRRALRRRDHAGAGWSRPATRSHGLPGAWARASASASSSRNLIPPTLLFIPFFAVSSRRT
jgi:multiple sugar transport system permease protein